jgi:hypothetical protein
MEEEDLAGSAGKKAQREQPVREKPANENKKALEIENQKNWEKIHVENDKNQLLLDNKKIKLQKIISINLIWKIW